ncbi:MAG TPA: PAS domain S-box protein [Deltaproteobacteria bacterium]|jgi:PAS domain S-box-containing protein|nr:PAS domain S-box protein [Deltaproteobacteria bacterium]HOI06076.1 PAS domain S-box protein [Deltaproteobacteria bacterium]
MDNIFSPVHEEDLRKEIETLRRQLRRVRAAKGRMNGPEPYLSILEDLPDLLCLFSPDGTIAYANGAFCRHFCRSRYEPVGNSIFSYIPRKDRKRFARNMEKLGPTETSRGFEYRVTCIDGQTRWHQWTLKALMAGTGTPIDFLLTGRDITSLKSIEEDLIDALEKYATLFEATKDAIVIHDAERFIDCNSAALEMFRCGSKDCFLHSSYLDFSVVGPSDGKALGIELRRHIDKAFRHGVERFQWACRRTDGVRFHADILLSPFPLGTRKVIASVIRDITELKFSEESLRKAYAELQTLARERTRELRRADRQLAQEIQKRKKLERHLKISEDNFRKASVEIKAMRRKTS